jgi:hypothetical protein
MMRCGRGGEGGAERGRPGRRAALLSLSQSAIKLASLGPPLPCPTRPRTIVPSVLRTSSQIRTRSVACRIKEPATVAGKKRVCVFYLCLASLLPSLLILSPVRCTLFLFSSSLALQLSAGDGNPSASKCSHCMSAASDCIFTESTKVRFFFPDPRILAFD